MNEPAVAERIRQLEIGTVEVLQSPVPLSPHEYVYVFFTEEKLGGHHLAISDRRELEHEEGYIVTEAQHDEDTQAEMEYCESIDEVCAWCRRAVAPA